MSGKKIKKENFKGISQTKIRMELDFLEKQNTQILGDLSIVEIDVSRSFSFRQTAFDPDSIENPNIVETEFSELKNNLTKVSDKFDEIEDPFFDLDDARESISKRKIMKQNNLKNLARRISSTGNKAGKRGNYK
tara:strand:+ start:66462 stop:66863 length:402 start_codon:yes stop_codon:yes gene_type:complete